MTQILKKGTKIEFVDFTGKVRTGVIEGDYRDKTELCYSVSCTEKGLTGLYSALTSKITKVFDVQVPSGRVKQLEKSLSHYITKRNALIQLLPADPKDNKSGYRQLHKLEEMINLRQSQIEAIVNA